MRLIKQEFKRGWVNLCLLSCCLVLWLGRDLVDIRLLEYQRDQLFSQPWRLFSGHLLHFTWQHACVNLAALAALMLAFAPEQYPKFDGLFWLAGAPLLSLFMAIFAPDIQVYRGLSGLLYGYALYLAIMGWRSTPKLSGLLIVFLLLRLLAQCIYPSNFPSVSLGAEIATSAHIGGIAFGFLCASWRILYDKCANV